MKDKRLVSVILPIYNQENFLHRSLSSIQKQTYETIEIILVDDGSTDSSMSIMEEYAEKDKRIKIIQKENGGLVDATLVGINNSSGDYICFLDPDDYVGAHFVENFISQLDQEYDFVAMGFFYENKGIFTPYYLCDSRTYTEEELKEYTEKYLMEKNAVISNRFFISRWNKIYKASCVKSFFREFEGCKGVSLGEDSIFTYLLMVYAANGKTVGAANSYYYNIANPNSMMNKIDIHQNLKKCRNAFEALKKLQMQHGNSLNQSYALYFFLVNTLQGKVRCNMCKEQKELNQILKKDVVYSEAKRIMISSSTSLVSRIKIISKCIFSDKMISMAKKKAQELKKILSIKKSNFFCIKNNILKKGLKSTLQLLKFQKSRYQAFEDMEKNVSKIEKEIYPFLQPYIGKKTDVTNKLGERVFVFWWDGFANAPEIVKKCLESVKKHHSEKEIILIDKHNFKEYTDIHDKIIEGHEQQKISVQTFSDILRFNLLKNNGGTWIDATIFFMEKYDLEEKMGKKSFESLDFESTKDFFSYEDLKCSWSGFFISARENCVLVDAMDTVFREYYLKYNCYPIYFFIDVVFMICKKYKIDDGVLDKISASKGSMFALSGIINEEFNSDLSAELARTPQKLKWMMKLKNIKENSFYENILMR